MWWLDDEGQARSVGRFQMGARAALLQPVGNLVYYISRDANMVRAYRWHPRTEIAHSWRLDPVPDFGSGDVTRIEWHLIPAVEPVLVEVVTDWSRDNASSQVRIGHLPDGGGAVAMRPQSVHLERPVGGAFHWPCNAADSNEVLVYTTLLGPGSASGTGFTFYPSFRTASLPGWTPVSEPDPTGRVIVVRCLGGSRGGQQGDTGLAQLTAPSRRAAVAHAQILSTFGPRISQACWLTRELIAAVNWECDALGLINIDTREQWWLEPRSHSVAAQFCGGPEHSPLHIAAQAVPGSCEVVVCMGASVHQVDLRSGCWNVLVTAEATQRICEAMASVSLGDSK